MLFHERASIEQAARALESRIGGPVQAAAVLGSGFAPLLELLEGALKVPFADVPALGVCTAPGHAGEIVAGSVDGRRYALFSGRLHLYEGHAAAQVAVPVALARAMGADRIVLTCATGATHEGIEPGSFVLIEDHLNLTGANPLLAIPPSERRPAFLPMGRAYDPAALQAAEQLGGDLRPCLRRGVLASLPGPSFETPAEYRMLARLGADVVSMSTALETIAARYLGMKVLALAVVANGPARPGEAGAEEGDVLELAVRAVRARMSFFGKLFARFAAL